MEAFCLPVFSVLPHVFYIVMMFKKKKECETLVKTKGWLMLSVNLCANCAISLYQVSAQQCINTFPKICIFVNVCNSPMYVPQPSLWILNQEGQCKANIITTTTMRALV